MGAPKQNSIVYIGTAPCGCIQAAVVGDPGYEETTKRGLVDMVDCGLLIDRIAFADFKGFVKCKDHSAVQEKLAF